MRFVDHYLPYFRQQLITLWLPMLLPFQSLFTESSHIDQLLSSPPFSSALTAPNLLCSLFIFSFLGFFFSARQGVSLSRRLCWFIPGVAVQIPHYAYLLTCWSPGCLPSRIGASVWWSGSPPVFSV
jgi:hypothetical protein